MIVCGRFLAAQKPLLLAAACLQLSQPHSLVELEKERERKRSFPRESPHGKAHRAPNCAPIMLLFEMQRFLFEQPNWTLNWTWKWSPNWTLDGATMEPQWTLFIGPHVCTRAAWAVQMMLSCTVSISLSLSCSFILFSFLLCAFVFRLMMMVIMMRLCWRLNKAT